VRSARLCSLLAFVAAVRGPAHVFLRLLVLSGYICSVLFEQQENALLMAVVACLLSGLATDNDTPEKSACWTRWMGEALFLVQVRATELNGETRDLYQAYMDYKLKFNLDNLATCMIGNGSSSARFVLPARSLALASRLVFAWSVLFLFGVLFRGITIWLMRRRHRKIDQSS
jgi:hypothetical protein